MLYLRKNSHCLIKMSFEKNYVTIWTAWQVKLLEKRYLAGFRQCHNYVQVLEDNVIISTRYSEK